MKEKMLIIEKLKAEFVGLEVEIKEKDYCTQFCFKSSYFVAIPVVRLGGDDISILSLTCGYFYAVVTIYKQCMFD